VLEDDEKRAYADARKNIAKRPDILDAIERRWNPNWPPRRPSSARRPPGFYSRLVKSARISNP